MHFWVVGGIDEPAIAGVAEKGRAIRAMKAPGALKAGNNGSLGGMIDFWADFVDPTGVVCRGC